MSLSQTPESWFPLRAILASCEYSAVRESFLVGAVVRNRVIRPSKSGVAQRPLLARKPTGRGHLQPRGPPSVRLHSAPDPAGASQEAMRPKKTILCIDHNEQALSVRKFMLETRGYRVLASLLPEEALDIFRGGGIDLVLSDLHLPHMDGDELARRMKEIAAEIPILLISGSVKAFERATHGDCFLPKGACSSLDVLDKVRMMLARKRGPKKQGLPQGRIADHAERFDRPEGPGMPAFAS